MRLLLPCLLVASIANCVLSARILAVLPVGGRSHHIFFHSVLKALAARGHQVVNYSTIPLEKKVANYTDVLIEGLQVDQILTSIEVMESFMNMFPGNVARLVWDFGKDIVGKAFEDEKVLELMKSDEKFDLVIIEAMFGQEALLAFGHKFSAPVINLHTFGEYSPVKLVSGNSLALEYIPDFPFPFSDQMTFYERVLNAYSTLNSLRYYYATHLPGQEAIARKVFKDPKMPPVVDMLHNISLFVCNVNPYVHYSQPYSSNVIPVGGIHLSAERKPLPQAMREFLDDAKEGVIYLSLGSLLPDDLLPQQFFDNFINAFRRLPYKVLWKTSSSRASLPGKVLTSKWAPQQDILAHPNVVLFITHGGMLSQHEVIAAGVPVICIPFLGDQPINAKFYEAREIGVRLFFEDLSENSIYSAVTTVLSTPKYKDNMARLSRIYRDQQNSPANRLVFWVEYVLRHGGAQHLRPASALMPWYRHYLLDIAAAAAAVVAVTVLVACLVVRRLCTWVFRRQSGVGSASAKKTN